MQGDKRREQEGSLRLLTAKEEGKIERTKKVMGKGRAEGRCTLTFTNALSSFGFGLIFNVLKNTECLKVSLERYESDR